MIMGYLDRLEEILRAVYPLSTDDYVSLQEMGLPPERIRPPRPLRWCWSGSRDMPEEWLPAITNQMMLVESFVPAESVTIYHGDARGADRAVGRLAKARGYRVQEYPVLSWEWRAFGGRAGHMRNAQMLQDARPQVLSVLLHRGSRGTTGCRDTALSFGIPVVQVDEEMIRLPRIPARRAKL